VDGEPEVVEFGGPGHPDRRSWLLPVAVALLAGLAVGFLIGRNTSTAPVAAPQPSATVPEIGNPLSSTGRTCAITLPGPGGKADLELGMEIRNRSSQGLTLETPGVDLPLKGLTIARPPTLTACGELPGITDTVLDSGHSVWLSVRVHVPHGDCPAALPVLFVVNYRLGTEHDRANVGGFNDLGRVAYPGCP
jgi:hypothetical protein